jgi:hypothetical protein
MIADHALVSHHEPEPWNAPPSQAPTCPAWRRAGGLLGRRLRGQPQLAGLEPGSGALAWRARVRQAEAQITEGLKEWDPAKDPEAAVRP